MYTPPQFKEERQDVLEAAIEKIQLATIVTATPDGYHATHAPAIAKREGGTLVLESHVARANPHWKVARAPIASLAVFQGPQAYVSPSWYASKREHGKVVPTWNYIAVHAHGRLSAVDEGEWLLRHVTELTARNEGARELPWAVSDAPADFIGALTRGIVGLRLAVERLEGSWKLAQHKPDADRRGAMAGLADEGDAGARAIAALMAEVEAARAAKTN